MKKYAKMSQKGLTEALEYAIYNNDLELVKYLVASPELTKHANPFKLESLAVYRPCQNGQIPMLEYLLSIPGMITFLYDPEQKSSFNDAINRAAESGKLQTIQFIVNCPELRPIVDIHYGNDGKLRFAANNGNLDIVTYLLTSPELPKNGYSFCDVHANKDEIFIQGSISDRQDLVQYLLFDYGISKSDNIVKFFSNPLLHKNGEHPILKQFTMRDLQQNLEKNLTSKNYTPMKTKI